MSEKIAFELRNWILSLGFQDKNVSFTQIEEEFQRLSPPELRDIWRSFMIHVIPVKEARYIKKVIMLHELNTYKASKKKKLPIAKNTKTLQELELFKCYEEVHERLNQCYKSIAERENEIASFNDKVADEESEYKRLIEKKKSLDHITVMIELKSCDREKAIKEFLEIHSYINYLNSFWKSEKYTSEDDTKDRSETVKDGLRNVNDFNRQLNVIEMDSNKERENLKNNIIRLSSNIPISSLYKTVIDMLKDNLGAAMKLADYINSKQDTEGSWLNESKLNELKKKSVACFLNNISGQKDLQCLREKIQSTKSELLDAMSDNNYMKSHKETFKIWLESECLKQCMITRESYLRNEFSAIKNRIDKIVDFSNEEDKTVFFSNFYNINNHMFSSEHEVMNNINYLSDEPINKFIECQNYCIKQIELFIEQEKKERLMHFSDSSSQLLTEELSEIKDLELPIIFNSIRFSEIGSEFDDLPYYYVNVCAEQCYYLIYLVHVYDILVEKFGQSPANFESIQDKRTEMKKDQEEFLNLLKKSVHEAKTNLQNVENYSADCSKNVELWIKLSGNDIVPKGILVADKEFGDWLKRYVSVIQCLRQKNNKTVY